MWERLYAILVGLFFIFVYCRDWRSVYLWGKNRSLVHYFWGEKGSRIASLVVGVLFLSVGLFTLFSKFYIQQNSIRDNNKTPRVVMARGGNFTF